MRLILSLSPGVVCFPVVAASLTVSLRMTLVQSGPLPPIPDDDGGEMLQLKS